MSASKKLLLQKLGSKEYVSNYDFEQGNLQTTTDINYALDFSKAWFRRWFIKRRLEKSSVDGFKFKYKKFLIIGSKDKTE